MNPERQPSPQMGPSPEMHHSAPETGGDHLPNQETSGESTHESEQSIQRGEKPGPAPPPINVALPTATVALPTPVQQAADDTAGPTIAGDDDLIEKEWVDKAKQIISQTQNDPYKREKEIGKLQADYLRKRYGKELGVSN